MRILDIIREFVEPPQSSGPNAEDLLYLLDNAKLSSAELEFINKSLSQIVGDQEEQDVGATDTEEPVDQATAQEPVTAEPATQEPVDSEPIDDEETTDDELQERTATKKSATKKKTKSPASYRQQLEEFLSQIQDDSELAPLVFTIYSKKFSDLTKEIVKAKIHSKASETYSAIEATISKLGNTGTDVSLMLDFLNECLTTGVIDAPAMISGETMNNKIPLTNDAYEPIIKAILDITLPGGAAVGKGEIGIAFAGIDSLKEVTDVSIGGTAVEVKASKGTSDFYMKGTAGSGFGYHIEGVLELVKHLNDAGANFKKSNEVKSGGIAQLNDKTVNALQPYFRKMGAKKTRETLIKVLKKLHNHAPYLVENYREEIEACVDDETGRVDYNMLLLPTAKLNFAYYKQTSKHDGVMMLNIDSFTYTYVADPEAFAELVANGTLKQKGAMEFRTNSLGGLAYFLNPVEIDY